MDEMEVAKLFNMRLVSGCEEKLFRLFFFFAGPEEGCQRCLKCYCNNFVIKNKPKMAFMLAFTNWF